MGFARHCKPALQLIEVHTLHCTVKAGHTKYQWTAHCILLLPPSCLLSGALTGIGSCLAPTCYTSNLAELLLYWQLLQNWHLLAGTCVNPTKVHTHSWSALPAVSQIYPGAINSTCVHKNLTISSLVFECIHTCPRGSAWRLNFCWQLTMLNFWIMFAD